MKDLAKADGTKIPSFSMNDINSADVATMYVVLGGKVTDWGWSFAGPGHDKTIAQANRVARESLHLAKEQRAAQVNGRKWKAPEESPDDIRRQNVDWVLERLLGWNTVEIDNADFPFSEANARALLSDPRKSTFIRQAMEFLGEESSFTQR